MSTDKKVIGIQMAKTFKAMGSLVSNMLREKKIDVHMEQLIVLETLYHEDSMIQQELADRLKKDKSTILRVIDALEKKQYVVRVPDADDRRKKNIVLTKKGADVYLKGLEVETIIHDHVLNHLSEAQLSTFSEILQVMDKNIR